MKEIRRISKFASLLLCLVLFASCFACNGGGNESSSASEKTVFYSVSFDTDGGSSVKRQSVESGKTAVKPEDPVLSGFTFGGWYYLGREWDFATPVTENLTLFAKWYDNSVKYRVTTGVETSLASRGSAEIVGQTADSVRLPNGCKVALKATANEGYVFAGWIDNDSGEIVSMDEVYTFTLEKETVLRASFKCVITGLDNAANAELWNALNGTDTDRAEISLIKENHSGAENSVDSLALSYDRHTGVMKLVIEENGKAVFGFYAVRAEKTEGVESYDYTFYNITNGGVELITEPNGVYALLAQAVLQTGEISDADREQALLSVYNIFRGNLYPEENGLSFVVPAEEYLRAISELVAENADKTAYSIAYRYLNDALDKIMEDGSSNVPGNIPGLGEIDSLSMISVGKLLEIIAKQSDVTVEQIDDGVYAAIDALYEIFNGQGLAFNKEDVKNLYAEIKKESVRTAIERLNVTKPGGNVEDIPESANVYVAVLYAVLNNYTVGGIADIVVRGFNLKGTVWDITDGNADFSKAVIPGEIIIENGVIKKVSASASVENNEAVTSARLNIVFGNALNPPFDN